MGGLTFYLNKHGPHDYAWESVIMPYEYYRNSIDYITNEK